MTEKLTEITAPAWMIDLFKVIDALDFDPKQGFGIFADDVWPTCHSAWRHAESR